MNLSVISEKLTNFVAAGDWDRFHSPKNLSIDFATEAAELLEIFQWLTEDQSREIVSNDKEMQHVREELLTFLSIF